MCFSNQQPPQISSSYQDFVNVYLNVYDGLVETQNVFCDGGSHVNFPELQELEDEFQPHQPSSEENSLNGAGFAVTFGQPDLQAQEHQTQFTSTTIENCRMALGDYGPGYQVLDKNFERRVHLEIEAKIAEILQERMQSSSNRPNHVTYNIAVVAEDLVEELLPSEASQPAPVSARRMSSSSIAKRHRTTFSYEQLHAMEQVFRRQQKQTRLERIKLAKAIDLTEQQVKNWFQNRRQKEKK